VITVAHAQSGKVFPPFIVLAQDEAAARKMCKRNYLVIQTVEVYQEKEGEEKPRVLKYGPPISDKDFERDYGNRPAGRRRARLSIWHFLLGWLACGPIGVLIVDTLVRSNDEPDKRD
jgi:hypothetical protein